MLQRGRGGATRRLRALRLLVIWTVAAACGAGGSSDRDAEVQEVQWQILGSGAVYAQCQRLPQEPRWTVEADLRLGSVEGPGEAVFSEIRGVEVDARGRLLVLDHKASTVRVFDSDGRFLEIVASPGEGPGAISRANGIRLDSEGALWIHDYGRLRFTRLLPDGDVETYPLFVQGFELLWEGGITTDGRLWSPSAHAGQEAGALEPGVSRREKHVYYKSLDPVSGALDSILIGVSPYHSIVTDRGMIEVPYSPSLLHALDPAGFIWTALSDEYLLTRQTTRGDTVLVIAAGCEAPLLTREERRQVIERVERLVGGTGSVQVDWDSFLPDHRPVLEQLVVDDHGRIWVVRATADAHVLDVFDSRGRFLGTIEPGFDFAENFPPIVRDDRLYVLQVDSLDVPFVVRAPLPAIE